MAKKMLIDATHAEETRVVVVDGNKVEEFDFETVNKRQLAGNIYLAKVTRVEPSLQAAFVEYGGNRHGFLAFAEIHPDYYQIPVADRQGAAWKKSAPDGPRRGRGREPSARAAVAAPKPRSKAEAVEDADQMVRCMDVAEIWMTMDRESIWATGSCQRWPPIRSQDPTTARRRRPCAGP
jgi:ribonuclease E